MGESSAERWAGKMVEKRAALKDGSMAASSVYARGVQTAGTTDCQMAALWDETKVVPQAAKMVQRWAGHSAGLSGASLVVPMDGNWVAKMAAQKA